MQERLELTHLDLDMPDIHGFIPDPYLIGNLLTHTARENQYIITGFAWMGSTDEWGYEHRLVGEGTHGPTIVRPLKDLAGNRHNGETRYQEYVMYAHYLVTD